MCKRVSLLALVVAVADATVFGDPALAGKSRLGTTIMAELTRPPYAEIFGDALLHLFPPKNNICYRLTVDDTQCGRSKRRICTEVPRANPIRPY